MNGNITPRTMISIGIWVLIISVVSSSFYLHYYMNNEIKPILTHQAVIIRTETLTRNALVSILVEKGLITKDEINTELDKITAELEQYFEEKSTQGIDD